MIQATGSSTSAPAGSSPSNANGSSQRGIFGYEDPDNVPLLVGSGMFMEGTDLPSCPATFLEPQRYYEPMYGTQDTLTDTGSNGQDGNLVLTEPDGTIYIFGRPDNSIGPFSTAAWEETHLAQRRYQRGDGLVR